MQETTTFVRATIPRRLGMIARSPRQERVSHRHAHYGRGATTLSLIWGLEMRRRRAAPAVWGWAIQLPRQDKV